MQNFFNDKENQIPPITLDFKKKAKSKPNSERTNSSSSLLRSPNTKLISNHTITLLEKKKQYSQSLREKNVPKQTKSRQSEALQDKINNQISKFQSEALKLSKLNTLNNVSEYYSTKTQHDIEPKKNAKPAVFHLSSKKEQKSKLRDTKKQKSRMQQTSLMKGVKNLSFTQNLSIMSISQNCPEQSLMNQDFSVIEKIDELSRIQNKNQLSSKEVDECIGPFQTEEQKEFELIKKQNNTFKKELANFRKENSSLKREVDELKKQLAVFKQRNQYLENQSTQQFKMLESLQIKMSQSMESLPELQLKEQKVVSSGSEKNEQKLKEIIANYENELFQATNLNKKLQFRNYMLEKRLMDEGEIHKKQMAKQISIWKQRYIKARNQNLRLKDSRNSMLFEMSISQQM